MLRFAQDDGQNTGDIYIAIYSNNDIFGDMLWTVETLDSRVDNELEALDSTLKAKLVHVVQLLESFGPRGVGLPHVKPLGEKLWEIRLKGKPGIARVIYITRSGRRIVLLHAFVKNGQKTPRKAMHIAQARLTELSK